MDILPRNVITRALGMQDSVVVDLSTEDIRPGDRFVLCSDGLSGQVTDERICEILSEMRDLDQCTKQLVEESNRAGGEDNVTVVVVALES
jgi:serine/threonine protein phosphatase PrpC